MIKLVIDPGHGGRDPGAVGNGLQEKDLNLEISKILAEKLSVYDAAVTLTRNSDIDLELAERCLMANDLAADYFCSIHVNAGGGTGFESYTYTGAKTKTESLRSTLHGRVADYMEEAGFVNRGKKQANFYVLRETEMPAVLLENLFIDNKIDASSLNSTTFLDGLAGAIAGGLTTALEIPLKTSLPEKPVPDPVLPNEKPWDPAGEIAKLKADGIINSDHEPGDPVTWGEMATVLNRLRSK